MSVSSLEVQKFREIVRGIRRRIESLQQELNVILVTLETVDSIAIRLIEAFHTIEASMIPDALTQHAFEDEEKRSLRQVIKDLEKQIRSIIR